MPAFPPVAGKLSQFRTLHALIVQQSAHSSLASLLRNASPDLCRIEATEARNQGRDQGWSWSRRLSLDVRMFKAINKIGDRFSSMSLLDAGSISLADLSRLQLLT